MLHVPIDPYTYDNIARLGGLEKRIRRVKKIEKSTRSSVYDEAHPELDMAPIYPRNNRRQMVRRVKSRPNFKRNLAYDTRSPTDRRR